MWYFLTEFSVELNLHVDGKDSCLYTDRWMFMPCVLLQSPVFLNAQAHLLGDIYFEMRYFLIFYKLFRLLYIFASFPCQGLNDLSEELFTFQWSSLQVSALIVLVLCFLVRWIFFSEKYPTCYSPNWYLNLAAMTLLCSGFCMSHVCFRVSESGVTHVSPLQHCSHICFRVSECGITRISPLQHCSHLLIAVSWLILFSFFESWFPLHIILTRWPTLWILSYWVNFYHSGR